MPEVNWETAVGMIDVEHPRAAEHPQTLGDELAPLFELICPRRNPVARIPFLIDANVLQQAGAHHDVELTIGKR